MGRPVRSRIDFAKTLSWYDFFYNKLLNSGEIRNEFGLEKLLYENPQKDYVTNLFKKYKFGLSTPKDYWISTVDSKCIGSSQIINHPLWKILKYQTFDEDLILLELTTLPHYIVEIISSNERIKDFNKRDLEHIASYGSLDSVCALSLLHHWGITINSTALANDCCSLLINSLGLLLEKNPHLHRSHVFLFDELCYQIFLMELKGYSRPLKIKLNWREYRRKNWSSAVKEISTKAEADFRAHPKLQDFVPSTDPNLVELYKKLFV